MNFSVPLPEKMAHAYILKGPEPAELLAQAQRLAAWANCLAPQEKRPCGLCESCRRIFDGLFEDWFYLEPQGAGNLIRINQIRQLQEDLSLRPRAGRVKIGVLDQAHRMQEASQNCLLKTLEEPPKDSLLLLLTDRPQDLLPTVLSRCQILTVEGEPPKVSREDLELAAEIWSAVKEQGLAAVFERAEFVQGSRKKALPQFLSALELLLRNGMRTSLTGELFPREEDGPRLEPMAVADCLTALDAVWQAGYLLDRNVNALLVIENLFLALWQVQKGPAL